MLRKCIERISFLSSTLQAAHVLGDVLHETLKIPGGKPPTTLHPSLQFDTWLGDIICRVRELETVRFGKRTGPALYRDRSPLMRREGAAVR